LNIPRRRLTLAGALPGEDSAWGEVAVPVSALVSAGVAGLHAMEVASGICDFRQAFARISVRPIAVRDIPFAKLV